MDMRSARDVVFVRAVEQTDRERVLLNDDDRSWAGRAAAEVVGGGAGEDAFIARRALLAMERLAQRHRSVRRVMRSVAWPSWLGALLLALAFALGVGVDQLAGGQRINILAPPILALLLWNIAVYLAIFVASLASLVRRGEPAPGPIRGWLARLGGGAQGAVNLKHEALANAAAEFSRDWVRLSSPLLAARVARVLHLSAAAFALGAILGMYLRGLAFEYRAVWESTFLSAEAVHQLLRFVLAPGVALTGIAIPDVNHLAALRSTNGQGENAAPWLHLYAVTVAAVVVVPRIALSLIASFQVGRYEARFPLPLEQPYFQRLLRSFTQRPPRVRVIPYSYSVPESSVRGLEAVLRRLYGDSVELVWVPAVRYGDEDAVEAPADGVIVALFNLAATAEVENQSAFVASLVTRARGLPLLAIVDESGFASRFAATPSRLEERRSAWRERLESVRIGPVFLDLEAPDLPLAETALEHALEEGA